VIIIENAFSLKEDSSSIITQKTKSSMKGFRKRKKNQKNMKLSNSSKYKKILENYN